MIVVLLVLILIALFPAGRAVLGAVFMAVGFLLLVGLISLVVGGN